ncbi:hypothetical protein [Achromobacter aloeverae]|uniref:Uncharacterized protein n=1 Tax=Achromobacter aloeverae TaxID=1750518 RepID=A0A4Q1HJY2_9BURK|nr:hypothetical protein [Achromobacter aloeverae]RXN90311.1 hypothetical protein C7R54_12395 [Achromobacter aloeverae]
MNSTWIRDCDGTAARRPAARVRGGLGACAAALALSLLAACSSTENVKDSYVPLYSASAGAQIRIHRPLSYDVEKVGKVQIGADSVWRQVGAIPQGDVFRQTGTSLLVNGTREAMMVVSADRIQGFFFDNGMFVPVEKGAGVTVVRR